MSWTWLGLAVLVLLAFSMVDGYRRGFIKEVVSVLLVMLSVVVVWLINPYVNSFIRDNYICLRKNPGCQWEFCRITDGWENCS